MPQKRLEDCGKYKENAENMDFYNNTRINVRKKIKSLKVRIYTVLAISVLVVAFLITGVSVDSGERVTQYKAEAAPVVNVDSNVENVESEINFIEYIPDISGIEETYISDEAYSACVKYGTDYNISAELLMAIVETESRGVPDAENAGCKGLIQVSERWHRDRMARLRVTDLLDTEQNIHVGTDYLAELFNKYEDVGFVLMIYNMGYEKANNYYSQGIISEYAQNVTARADELTILHTYGGVN